MFNKSKYIILILVLVSIFTVACSSRVDTVTNPPAAPDTPNPTPTPSTPAEQPSSLNNRVDAIYFHRPQRCVTCLCFEERIRYVVDTYFQDELKSGKLTFGVYNIGDRKNADIVKKYAPVSSSFFINMVKDDTENIRNIEEIWSWNCRSDKPGFDQKVKSVIEQSLMDVE